MNERPLTGRMRPDGTPVDLPDYRAAGGYEGLRRALEDLSPEEVVEEVKRSRLRGRGGAGFPTGVKWSFVPRGDDAPATRYLVVNADEMEPGTFKDRLLMESDPHQLVEGTLISAYAIGAEHAFIFLRWAYHESTRRLQAALEEARAAGLVGHDILGSGISVEVDIHASAGRYICGEETGLLNALEGRRAIPRAKPPFPPLVGVWGRPTVVNNVETLCNVPHILAHGADRFLELSRSEDGGTKVYGASGRVKRPGSWELPLGVTLREVLDEHAGGMAEGRSFRGALPGGASTDFLTADHLDVRLDFQSVEAAGSRLGTGTLVVLDDRTCPVGMVLNLERFFAQESCGWCTPCREGLPWIADTLAAMEAGRGRPGDLELLEELVPDLGMGRTFCALAPGAMAPLGSALRHFREDFERHIAEGRCPYRRSS